MSDLIARESSRPDWDEPLVDLVEEDEVVGCVYLDEGTLVAEFYADDEGEPWIFEVADLQRALDTAASMLEVEGTAPPAPGPGDVHPVDQLASEFDLTAARRGEEDEGFYPLPAARRIVGRCDELGLAVAGLEGFEVRAGELVPLAGHRADVAEAHRGEPWELFKAGCNTQAAAVLEKWVRSGQVLAALEVEDRDGESYVL